MAACTILITKMDIHNEDSRDSWLDAAFDYEESENEPPVSIPTLTSRWDDKSTFSIPLPDVKTPKKKRTQKQEPRLGSGRKPLFEKHPQLVSVVFGRL
ncbi:hypothetical protein HOLleu_27033 [Holothuria leucospilota]|uniref:Uncharacterized protein n=1 Tax=Holothuria leucospilota TaxID=206669 RepID=A0A9Q1BPY9_HOLLE|nr:hypothetical protein HOLleu_27033 [Holothuria leucospilota]